MLIVAIDTSGRKGSIAVCCGDRDTFEVLQLTPLEGGTYSALLMPSIAEALKAQHLSKADVDGLVAVSGPGSFTGLRVGLSTVKALCEVLRKPLATVSMLEAIALTYGQEAQTVTALLDAGRGESFVGKYRVAGGHAQPVQEYIAKVEALLKDIAALPTPILTPDSKLAEALQSGAATVVAAVRADEIGRIGIRKLAAGETADPETVDANYIRRSDAEIFATKKH
jgi:tRNA threonylcarbamoyladenosine biosynthesis protein TsaB